MHIHAELRERIRKKRPEFLKNKSWVLHQGGRDSVEEDETAGRPWSAITDQSTVKIRDMSGFPLTSVVRKLINTNTLKN
ncbi:hypothetical protein TNCV_2314371 [Trichonephila clavipes]|nr:hypothetical protein TNCV_2314371 [Trichonephila clavipes]